jgi:hypothetical protein
VAAPKEVVYLSVDDIVDFYGQLFGCSHDVAADQLLDRAGLEGGLARPRQYGEMGEDLATQPAALTHAIAEGQRFVDGNKRTALLGLDAFLELLLSRAADVSLGNESGRQACLRTSRRPILRHGHVAWRTGHARHVSTTEAT